MADRPIIRLQLAGDTVDEFQRAAALNLGREFFVELDTPAIEQVRIEAPFKSGAIAVRAEAVTKAATREGRSGALVRLTKLEPTSYGVPIPPNSAWPLPEDVSEVRRQPSGPVSARTTTPVAKPALARTATPHVVRRVIEVDDDDDGDPVTEFANATSITKDSPVSADLAKQLNERPTPPPAPTSPKTPSIIRRQPAVAGIPSIPKPVEKKIATPPPPVDDEWSFDALTLGGATNATAKAKLTPPAMPAVRRPPPTPAKGVAKKTLDDDAAFDDAFGMFEDDLSIPVEPATPPAGGRVVDEITKPVPAPELADRPTPPSVETTPRVPTAPPVADAKPRLPSQPPQDEIPTFDPAKPPHRTSEPAILAAEFAEPPKPAEITRPMTPSSIAELANADPASVARPSSEGVLATARASELAMSTGSNEVIDGTSTGATSSTRPASEALRSKSKLPLILVAVAALAGAIVVVIVLATGGGKSAPTPSPTTPSSSTKAEVDKHLREAASRIADGKLVGRGGDSALDHLNAAKAIAPDDPQVVAQLKALADTFEKLGDGALASNDLAEAATHYQAALTAEPDRASAKSKLADVENRARGKR